MKHDMRKCFTIIKKEDLQAEIDALKNKPITEHPDVQKLIAKMVVLQEKYDRLITSIKDARAKVREIKYHHTKPRTSRHGNTTQTCLLIESIFEQAIKEAKKIK